MDVLARVIPFFLLIGVGAGLARVRLIDLAGARALSAFVFWAAFPALLIHSLATMPAPDASMAAGLAVYALAAATPMAVTLILGRVLGWEAKTRGGAAMASITGNTAFLGAPLAVALFGPLASGPGAAVVAIDCTVIMALSTAALRGAAEGIGPWRAAAKTLKNPLVAAALTGTTLCLLHIALPGPIERTLGLLRGAASPVGLVALGAVIGLEAGRPSGRDTTAISVAVIGKLVLAPLLVWIGLGLIGADPMFRAVATLLAACPTAVNVFIQTRVFDAFARGGALSVVISSLLAAVSLTVLGAWLATGIG